MKNAHHRARSGLMSSSTRVALLGLALPFVLPSLGVSAAHAESPCGCSGDFNASGTVDAADLAILLGAWGANDADHDLSGNGTVEASDLGILLGQWGTCGAPSNDTCGTALLLPSLWSQTVPFCTVNAGTDGPANALCDASSSDQITNDIYFKVTAPADGMLDLSTCTASFDTKMAVYEQGLFGGSCPNDTIFSAHILGCNDDSVTCSDVLHSHLLVPVVEGETYTIRVGGYNGAHGTGELDVQFLPKGDLCSDAIPVVLVDNGEIDGVTVVLSGDTLHATASANSNPNSCGGVFDTKDLWFKVTANCTVGGAQPVSLTASTCMAGTGFDTTLTIYSGECDSLVELECNDDSTLTNCQIGGVNRRSYVSIDPQSNQSTYWVRLAGFDGAVGAYEIKFHFKCLN
jgi:hypothetical protein